MTIMRRIRGVGLALCAALCLVAASPAASHQALAAGPCLDVLILGLRGAGDNLTDYNPSTGASFVDFADGKGGWTGVKGPQFWPGWKVSTGDFDGDGLTDLFVYNPST